MVMLTCLINHILRRTKIMATIEEISAKASDLAGIAQALMDTLSAQNAKLDEIKDFISRIQGGNVSQEQLNDLVAKLDSAKELLVQDRDSAAAILAKTDSLDDPAPVA